MKFILTFQFFSHLPPDPPFKDIPYSVEKALIWHHLLSLVLVPLMSYSSPPGRGLLPRGRWGRRKNHTKKTGDQAFALWIPKKKRCRGTTGAVRVATQLSPLEDWRRLTEAHEKVRLAGLQRGMWEEDTCCKSSPWPMWEASPITNAFQMSFPLRPWGRGGNGERKRTHR